MVQYTYTYCQIVLFFMFLISWRHTNRNPRSKNSPVFIGTVKHSITSFLLSIHSFHISNQEEQTNQQTATEHDNLWAQVWKSKKTMGQIALYCTHASHSQPAFSILHRGTSTPLIVTISVFFPVTRSDKISLLPV